MATIVEVLVSANSIEDAKAQAKDRAEVLINPERHFLEPKEIIIHHAPEKYHEMGRMTGLAQFYVREIPASDVDVSALTRSDPEPIPPTRSHM